MNPLHSAAGLHVQYEGGRDVVEPTTFTFSHIIHTHCMSFAKSLYNSNPPLLILSTHPPVVVSLLVICTPTENKVM